MISMSIQVYFQQEAVYRTNRYPSVECSIMTNEQDLTADELLENAILEWEENLALEERGENVSYSGYLQCFCDKEYENGVSPAKSYK